MAFLLLAEISLPDKGSPHEAVTITDVEHLPSYDEIEASKPVTSKTIQPNGLRGFEHETRRAFTTESGGRQYEPSRNYTTSWGHEPCGVTLSGMDASPNLEASQRHRLGA
ncbi:hypothetical protein BDW72DRAFT_190597 [Aspergillus terricola var. indicus]